MIAKGPRTVASPPPIEESAAPSLPDPRRSIAQVIAALFALAAFLVALTAGLSAGVEPQVVVARAAAALVVCWPIGWFAGRIAMREFTARTDAPVDLSPAPSRSEPEENPTSRQDLRLTPP